MILKRRTEHRVRMGEFESVVISAEVELDNAGTDDGNRETVAYANELLDAALADDIKELQETAESDSYILNWRK